MDLKLGETLRTLRVISGSSLRHVEKETGVSNAYLSQLETGATLNPSPQVLHKLAEYYGVPYESLMEAAGYLRPPAAESASRKRLGAIGVALMSAKLNEEEQVRVVEFIEFLRSQRRQRKKVAV
jgi:transcriptional regulator with XRE-family HTH domain